MSEIDKYEVGQIVRHKTHGKGEITHVGEDGVDIEILYPIRTYSPNLERSTKKGRGKPSLSMHLPFNIAQEYLTVKKSKV